MTRSGFSAYERSKVVSSMFGRLPGSLKVGLCIISIHLAVAVLGPFLVPYGYEEIGVSAPMSAPDWHHLFGTDLLGRDVFSRTIHGGGIVLLLSLASTGLGATVGIFLGLMSAYLSGWLDEVLQRILEALIAIPFLVLALLLVSAIGAEMASSPWVIVSVVGLIYTPRIARVSRAAALDIVGRDHVTAAELRGESPFQIVFREILPNTAGALIVECALRAAYAPALIGALGFLGFGLRPPTPEWGLMMSENRQLLLITPMTVLGPGLMLASLVVGINIFADGLSRLFDQSSQRGAA